MIKRALYRLIKENIVNGELPDEFSLPSYNDPGKLRFADGAADGIAVYHMGKADMTDDSRTLMEKTIRDASNGDFEAALRELSDFAANNTALSSINDIQDFIVTNRDGLVPRNIHKFATMCAIGEEKEIVKFGLSILEVFTNPYDNVKDLVRTLGLSDEFTLFALFNMAVWENANEEIFSLARKVHGWGRIHAVERLEPETDEIKEWLLCEGINNRIAPDYSALTVYNKTEVRKRLDGEMSDKEFHSVCEIIDALMSEGPVEGISAVDDAEEMLMAFLNRQVPGHSLDYGILNTVYYISVQYGGKSSAVKSACDNILHREDAKAVIADSLKKGKGIDIAQALNLEYRPQLLKAMRNNFDEVSSECRYLMYDNEFRDKVLDLYREKLPMDSMRTGPQDIMLFGEEKCHQSLVMLLQELVDFPLCGSDMVELGLQSPIICCRNMALRVIGEWCEKEQKPLKELSPELYEQVKLLNEKEPTDSVKGNIAKRKLLI